jgi:hypothetical protein
MVWASSAALVVAYAFPRILPAGSRRQRGRGSAAALLLVGQVRRHYLDPLGGHAPLAQQGAGLLQLRCGAREQDHPCVRAGKPERDCPADATPRTGDQRGLASEPSRHCCLLNG